MVSKNFSGTSHDTSTSHVWDHYKKNSTPKYKNIKAKLSKFYEKSAVLQKCQKIFKLSLCQGTT